MTFSMLLSGFHHHVRHLFSRNYGYHPTLVLHKQALIETSVCTHSKEKALDNLLCVPTETSSTCMTLKADLYLPNASHQPLRFHNTCCPEQMSQLWTPTRADGLQATRLQFSFLKWPRGIQLQVSYIWQAWSGTCQALTCIFRQHWHNHSGQKYSILSLY